MKRVKGMMDLKLLEDICKKVQGRYRCMFLHYYGESLNHPKFIEACNIVHKYGMNPGVFTCGSHLTSEYIKRIANSPLDYISVTMNRFSPLKQVEELRGACDKGVHIQVTFINLPDVPEKVRYNDLTSKELASWARGVTERTGKILYVQGLSYEFPEKVDGKLACSFKTKQGKCKIRLENMYCVLWDGKLVTCIKDYEGETSLGNVLDVLDKVNYESTLCPY
jgi:hypothetical protein